MSVALQAVPPRRVGRRLRASYRGWSNSRERRCHCVAGSRTARVRSGDPPLLVAGSAGIDVAVVSAVGSKCEAVAAVRTLDAVVTVGLTNDQHWPLVEEVDITVALACGDDGPAYTVDHTGTLQV
jgi:hypothetical protein